MCSSGFFIITILFLFLQEDIPKWRKGVLMDEKRRKRSVHEESQAYMMIKVKKKLVNNFNQRKKVKKKNFYSFKNCS